MDFATAWSTFLIGDPVAVSNDQPSPDMDESTQAMKIWRSHNFTGTLAEKIAGANRRMRFELAPNADGNIIGYSVAEDVPHSFVAA